MAVTDPQVVVFCNEKLRPIADRYAQLYWLSKIVQAEYNANNLAAKIPNDSTTIADNGDADGRGVITGAMVRGLVANLALLTGDLEANANVKLIGLTQIAVHEQP